MITHLLFDLDMTLLDFKASEYAALKDTFTNFGFEFDDDLYLTFSSINDGLWKALERKEVTKKELFETRFRETINWYKSKHPDFKCELPPYTDINSYYIDAMANYGITLPGAIEFLSKLKEERPDLKRYIITNGTVKTARGRYTISGLDKYFEDIFISDELGVNKPDKKFFDIVCEKIHASANECLVIGDSISSDIKGAFNSGIQSMWFTSNPSEEAIKEFGIKYVVSDYDEMLFELRKAK